MCTLRISGRELDPDALLRAARLAAAAVHRRGEPERITKPNGAKYEASNINITVSDADFDDLGAQIRDAEEFMRAHREALTVARAFFGVESVTLDFGTWERDVAFHCDTFPASLLALLGDAGVDLMLSRYPGDDEPTSKLH